MQEFGNEFDMEKFGGLNPVVNFEHPGDTFIGDYIGSREINFDGRVSRLYNFRSDQKFAGTDMIVSIWGSAVLDRIFLDVAPQMDDKLVIQYAGLGQNAKKGNPPKLFVVGRLNKK